MNLKRLQSILIIFCIIFNLAPVPLAHGAVVNPPPAVGASLHGFTVSEVTKMPSLSADTFLFQHDQSGASVLVIKNSDQNRYFNIGFRTPQVDESDLNHVLEHAVIAGSNKYPSHDLYFDIVNKSYNTYANAATFNSMTCYPLASPSEMQLLKLMDAYMSCLTDPLLAQDSRYFSREALRYELDSPEAPLEMLGIVYSEDIGSLTSPISAHTNHVLDTLYPDLYASNAAAQAFNHYETLTYERVMRFITNSTPWPIA